MEINLTNATNSLNGVLQYYYQPNKEHFRDFLKITASTNSRTAFHTLDTNEFPSSWNTNFNHDTPQWYQVELLHSILYIDSYTLQSSFNNETDIFSHLRGWTFTASIDGVHWELIDGNHTKTNVMFGLGIINNFKSNRSLYRFFRITETQRDENTNFGFCLRRFELFGVLYETGYVPHLIVVETSFRSSLSLSFLFIILQ